MDIVTFYLLKHLLGISFTFANVKADFWHLAEGILRLVWTNMQYLSAPTHIAVIQSYSDLSELF